MPGARDAEIQITASATSCHCPGGRQTPTNMIRAVKKPAQGTPGAPKGESVGRAKADRKR